MSQRDVFRTTTAAEFRKIAAAAHTSGRLNELIEALAQRLERYQSALTVHESTRDIQKVQETKKRIANLETKLEIAKQIEWSADNYE